MRDGDSRAAGGVRAGVPARVLGLWSAVGAALLLAVGFIAYRELLHYDRHAIEHVPPGSELALRVDLEQVVLFEPLRKHLLPLLDRAPLMGASPEHAAPSRLVRLREAGLNLAFDLREVVFAREPGGGWVLALGGMFGTEAVLDGIERVLKAEPGMHLRREAGVLTSSSSGLALAQAEDGVLLIASDVAVLARALPPSRAHEALGLGQDGAGALGALASWLDPLSPGLSASSASRLIRASARLELGDPLVVSARVERAGPSDLAAAQREVASWLGAPSGSDDFAPHPDWGGERALLARASFSAESETSVQMSTTWERAELDHAARSLAAWLETRFRAGGHLAQ